MSGEPGYGFAEAYTTSDGGAGRRQPADPWLPQPASFGELAADRQDGVQGSTLELYRSALFLRKSHGLGSGTFCWADAHDPELGVLAFQNRDVLVMANTGSEPAPVPDGYRVILSSDGAPSDDGALSGVPVTGSDDGGTAGTPTAVIAPNSTAYLVAG